MPIKTSEANVLKELSNHHKLSTKIGWQSFNRGNQLPQALVIDVENIEALQTVMREVHVLNKNKEIKDRITIRAAAGGLKDDSHSESYSFSPIAEADVIIRLVGDDFRKIATVSGTDNHVTVGASLQIGELDKALYENHDLSLPTSSLIPYVTVAGLSATAGHGTGKDQPSFAGLIRAMTLCLPNGEIVKLDKSHPDFETIRASHLGLFGIVIDVELACTPAMKIQTEINVYSAAEFLEKIKSGHFETEPYDSAMYMPTYYADEATRKDLKNVITYRWKPVPKSTPDMNTNPNLSKFGQYVAMQFDEGLHLASLLRKFPSLVPYYMRFFASKISVGSSDNISVGPWHEMEHYLTAFPHDLTELGVLFPVSNHTASDTHTPEIAEAFEKLLTELTASAAKSEYPLVYAAYFRYLQGTNHGLSTSMHDDNHHICSMDMTTEQSMPGFNEFARRMADFTLGKLHAKPHWGKNIPDQVNFKELYGDSYTKFINTLESWYTSHGMDLYSSPLLNSVMSHVLDLDHSQHAASTSKPESLSTWDDVKNVAEQHIETLGLKDDESEEAKALRNVLHKTCINHVESMTSRTLGRLFTYFHDTPADETSAINPQYARPPT